MADTLNDLQIVFDNVDERHVRTGVGEGDAVDAETTADIHNTLAAKNVLVKDMIPAAHIKNFPVVASCRNFCQRPVNSSVAI